MSTTEAAEKVPLDKLAKTYRRIRDKKAELQAKFDTDLAVLDEQLSVLAGSMKEQMIEAGVTSVRTSEGTVVLSTKTRYTVSDWDAFKTFVIEHEALDLFERRLAQNNMATLLKENPTTVVPTLNSNSEYSVSVRKPTN